MMWLKSIKLLSWIASLGLVSAAVFIAYIVLFPVDVLTNWKLTISKDTYYPGDVVVIESTYTKNATVTGTAKRYLECKNQSGVLLRYELNQAVANRSSAQLTGTGVTVTIPDRLAEITLPTDCFFSIGIEYDVYPRRAEYEYNRTQDFKLVPVDVVPTEKPTPTAGGAIERPEDDQPADAPPAVEPEAQATDTIPQREHVRSQDQEPSPITGIKPVDDVLHKIGL